jgi:hypothetical protein
MKKDEYIRRHGEEAWAKLLERGRARYKEHKEEEKARNNKYREENPEKIKARRKIDNQKQDRKGGKHYDKKLKYNRTGLRGERNKIRWNHGKQYQPYKDIIAPDSQLHHEWVPDSTEYRGVALVEAEPHQCGIVDVIKILDGEITLLTEEEVRKGKKNGKEDRKK